MLFDKNGDIVVQQGRIKANNGIVTFIHYSQTYPASAKKKVFTQLPHNSMENGFGNKPHIFLSFLPLGEEVAQRSSPQAYTQTQNS